MTPHKIRTLIGGACLLALTAASCGSDSKSPDTTVAAPAGTTAGTAAPAATAAGGSASSDTTPSSSASSDTTASGGTAAGATAATLTIQGFKYSDLTVAAGTSFEIDNQDSRVHTVTDDGGAFNVSLQPNGTASLSITAPGTYTIHCNLHSQMKGSITVT